MPIMLRTSKKAMKIAYTLLGNPLKGTRETPAERRINRRLTFEETARIR